MLGLKIEETADTELGSYKRLLSRSISRIAELESLVVEQAGIIKKQAQLIARQEVIIQEQSKEILQLNARVGELERMVSLNSRNSSKPPSSDGLRKPVTLREKWKRASGGQAGHKGYTLKQESNPDKVIDQTVGACEKCGEALGEGTLIGHTKRQVFDIPEPKKEVTEYRGEIRLCSCCGHTNKAKFPSEVTAPVQYGDRVQALAVYLNNQQLIPEDRLQQTFEDLFSLSISTATIVDMNKDFASKVQLEQEIVLQALKATAVKNLDESGVRIGGKLQWLHVISNDHMTHYKVTEKRGDIHTGLCGTLVHDHFKPYLSVPDVKHALCNAHHLRELKALEEIEKESWAFDMSKLLRTLNSSSIPIAKAKKLYDKIVADGLKFHEKQDRLGGRKKRTGHNLLIRLRDFKDATLRFLTDKAVPFTNNQAEQDIRMIKVKQKISGCFRTVQGAENFCTIRGFISTKRKQGHNICNAIHLALSW
jgi:transposase